MKIGFTGTRDGMSIRQLVVLRTQFAKHATEFHHGDCIGADALRIPIHAGHLFRDEAGHHSDLIPATVPR